MIATPRAPCLTVSALGGVEFSVERSRIELRSRKAQLLLVYLLLSPSGTETRGRLCGLLWSESSEERARASLRQLLHGLRAALSAPGFQGLDIQHDTIHLRHDCAEFDVARILHGLEAGVIPPSLVGLPEPSESLLAGFDGLDPAVDVWLAIQRRLFRDRLERPLNAILSSGSPEAERLAAARTLLNIDQTNEVACRALMAILALRGEIVGALNIFNSLREHLDQEYGAQPSAETKALALQLREGGAFANDAAQLAADTAVPLPAYRAIIVAPFDSDSVEKRNAYLVAGLRQGLIAKLIRFREWAVLDGKHVPDQAEPSFTRRWPEQIWVDAVVQQAGADLKITLSLRDQPSGRLIWGEVFQLALDRWFEVERELLTRIATIMNLHLSTARLLHAADKPDVSLEIYDRWLRGQAIIMNWRPERERARAIYRAILAEAPHFSPAHSSLAQLESSEHLSLPGVFRTAEREAAALDYARMAVRLDPFDSRAQLALGWASLLNTQFEQAYVAFTTALQLNENDPWTINSAALGSAYCGDVAQAIATVERGLTLGLKPTAFHAAYQGAIRFVAGDYAGAVAAYDAAGDIIADLGAWKAASLAHLGRTAEAKTAMRTFVTSLASRWTTSERPTESRLAAWFLHCFPMRDRQAWELLRDGARAAGLIVPPEHEIPRHP